MGVAATTLPGPLVVQSSEKPPRVLILGDSISIGYFPFVREMMNEIALVSRPFSPDGSPENCQGTTNGVVTIDRWIGQTKWDIIHFNFGLHDIKHVNPETGEDSRDSNDPHQADLKQYKMNLTEIVKKLKNTGAQLIFATTTPYPDTVISPMRLPGMSAKYNKVAKKIMKRNGVVINDLYGLVLPQMRELQLENNVHFTEGGYIVLGKRVTDEILKLL